VVFYNGSPVSGGVKIGEAVIAGVLNAGDSKEVAITWTVPATLTPLALFAVIDPDALLDPLSRSDNMISTAIIVPDLSVATAYWQKQSENIVTVTATVTNSGSLASTPTSVVFRKDGPAGAILSSQNLPVLAKGESLTLSFDYDITAYSDPCYTVYIAIDEANTVVEYDETNNNYSLIIPGKPADVIKSATVTIAGNGTGTVTSAPQGTNPAGINCATGTCSTTYPYGLSVELLGTPNAISVFDGWSGNCTGKAACTILMDGAKSVTATFTLAPKAKNISTGTPYTSIITAITDAVVGAEIQLLTTQFDGALILNKSLIVKGGRNALFTGLSGQQSVLNGGLTVAGGNSRLETIDVIGAITVKGGSIKASGVRVR